VQPVGQLQFAAHKKIARAAAMGHLVWRRLSGKVVARLINLVQVKRLQKYNSYRPTLQ
jgi:hypothetical protein